VHYGLSFGLGFALGVFNQHFGKPQDATLP